MFILYTKTETLEVENVNINPTCGLIKYFFHKNYKIKFLITANYEIETLFFKRKYNSKYFLNILHAISTLSNYPYILCVIFVLLLNIQQ